MRSFAKSWSKFMTRCSRCGLCLSVCPTYGQLRLETASPRGRLVLAQAVATRHIQPDAARHSLANCTLCNRCTLICPARIPLGTIFFASRALLGIGIRAQWRLLERVAVYHPRWLDLMQPIAAMLQSLWLAARKSSLAAEALPSIPRAPLVLDTVSRATEEANEGGDVLFFPGCITRQFLPRLGSLCLEALSQCGHKPFTIAELPCCGRPQAVQGRTLAGAVRQFIKVLGNRQFKYLVSPCPGCLHTICDLWPIADLTAEERAYVATLAGRCRDLVSMLGNLQGWHGKGKVFWHRPCLASEESEASYFSLLQDYAICRSSQRNQCCGAALHCLPNAKEEKSASAHSKLPLFAKKSLTTLAAALPGAIQRTAQSSGASQIATSCPGCLVFLRQVKMRGGAPLPVRHPLEILLNSHKDAD